MIKTEIRTGNILIVRITPLARKSVDETKLAITELTDHVKSIGGDIARLGEERIVITPPGVRIWRRETAAAEARSLRFPYRRRLCAVLASAVSGILEHQARRSLFRIFGSRSERRVQI